MIKVEELTRTYGDLTAVDQVSFEIGRGEIVGLLGHNGAGKTTISLCLSDRCHQAFFRLSSRGGTAESGLFY